MASLSEPCMWDQGTCKTVNKDFTKATCASLNDSLYNAMVCASITTTGEMCAYDSVTFHCISVAMVTDC